MNYIRQNYIEPFYNNTLRLRSSEKYKLKHGRRKTEYYDIPMSFDIETTVVIETEHSYMYIWQFGYICAGVQYVVKGRTWEEFDSFIMALSKKVGKKRVIVWVHNLSYEFMYLWGRFKNDITEMFCKEKYKPLKFVLLGNIEFRDSYILTNKSLNKLAQDFTHTQKLKGDLDFNIMRNSKTLLTEQEECYCDNDVIILCEFHQYVMKTWYDVSRETLPLTQTAILRSQVKKGVFDYWSDRVGKEHARNALKYEMIDKYPSEKLYRLMMRYCFKGGLTHANYHHVDEVLYDVDSYDFTSSYPAVMLQDLYYYPSKFQSVNSKGWTFEDLQKRGKEKCIIAICVFHKLQALTPHSIISKHKAMAYNGIIEDNGKIRYAESIQTFETELDLELYRLYYTWDSVDIIKVYQSDRITLPEYLKTPIRENYVAKARLKDEGKPYANEKAIVNSAYGLTCQRLVESEICFNDGEFSDGDAQPYEKQVSNSVLLPQWGIYVTAWARYNIATGIYYCGVSNNHENIYYYDTDSIKGHFDNNAKKYIEEYNKKRIDSNIRLCKKYNLPFKYFNDLGCYDYEGHYSKFSMLGAKRYIYVQDGVFHQTIAGLGKNAMMNTYNDIDKCFDAFAPNMEIDLTDKLRSVRNFEEHSDYVDGEKMHEYTSLCLVPVNFTMRMGEWFETLVMSYHEKNMKYEVR